MSRESNLVSSILSELGWDESLAIPIANDENKKLLSMIDMKQKRSNNNKSERERVTEKLSAMERHMRNCKEELAQVMEAKRAREEQCRSEDHVVQLDERESGRMKQEINSLESRLRDLRERRQRYENNLFITRAEEDTCKKETGWDSKTMEAWLEESEHRAEDVLSLQKYARQDEAKVQELSLQLERYTGVVGEKRTLLERAVVETRTTQVELEKTNEEFRRAHESREELMKQWEATIGQLRRRDDEIEALSNKLYLLKGDSSKLEEGLKSKEEFYNNLINNNKEIDKIIELTERQCGKFRMEQKDVELQRFNFQNELEALRRTCDRTASDLEDARVTISQLKKEKLEKEERKKDAIYNREDLEEKLQKVRDEKMSAEQKANMADTLLESEEKSLLKFEQKLKQIRDLQFKRAQELHDVETEQKNIMASLNGGSTAMRNLNGKIHQLDQDVLKQQEILYTQDFAIQQLERRINRMQGEHSNEEKDALDETIKKLTLNLEMVIKVTATLTSQIKRVQDDIRKCKHEMGKVYNENEIVTEKLEEVNLHNETSQLELKRTRTEKEKIMVEDNIMKLEIKRLRDRLYNKVEQVLTLDKRRLQLEQAVKERFSEINIHKEMLLTQIRSADEERSKINGDFKSRLSKIDKLQKRFEIITVSMAPPEGEKEQSQAYYVIKAAQDKEALQRQGDELDAKIRKAEKEIRALENTLMLMNCCNQNYRQSMMKVTDTSAEMSVKSDLETQLRTIMEKYNFKRKQLEQLDEDFQNLKETLENLNKDEVLYGDQVKGIMDQLIQKENERSKQIEKIERAEKQMTKLRNEIYESQMAQEFEFVENDMKVKEKREFNRIVINELQRCVQNYYPNLTPILEQFMANMLPVSTSSPLSSKVTSVRSSLSKPSSISSSRSSVISNGVSSVSVKSPKSGINTVKMTFGEDIRLSTGTTVKTTSKLGSIKTPMSSTTSSKASSARSTSTKGSSRGSHGSRRE